MPRGEKVRAHQQEDDLGRFQLLANFAPPILPRLDLAIVPRGNEAFAVEQRQMGF